LPAEPPPLPSDPEQWINGGPLTYDRLQGKGVVLWYFEETCPKCAGKWPAMLEMAEQYADQPVLFVAVNSGTDRRKLLSYVRKHDIGWPVLVDSDRSFEQSSGVPKISLQNIYTMRIVTPEGKFTYGYWSDWTKSLNIALDGAAWKVKYDRLHPSMHAAVHALEFGFYRPVAVAIAKGLEDDSPEVRQAAELVRDQVQSQMQKELLAAIAGKDKDDALVQFQALELVKRQFAPLELPSKASARLDDLRRDSGVQKEVRALKAVEINAKLMRSPEPNIQKRAITNLERMQKTYSGTRAAARAAELLAANPDTQPAE